MKKALLSLLLICFAFLGVARAQTTVEIGDGTTAGYYTPIGTLYNYSITEQLYTAEEIGMPGTIQSISFYYVNSYDKDFPIEVYMANVDAADLSTGISLADAELVFEGTYSVTAAQGWATITLDSPFVYDGTSNLLIGINKGYVQWFSNNTWTYTAAANMARYSQNDNNAYDTSTTPGTLTNNRPNIQMEIVAGSGPFCAKPTGVTVEYNGGTTATVSWNSEAASFNIDVNGTVTNNVSNPYTLNGLSLATEYTVKVQAVCGGENGSSDWTSGTSFSTDICMPEDQCNLTFVLTDSYGDGWNGNAIQVKDVETGIIIATLANQNLDGATGEETQTIELGVCDGREIELSWVSGSYVGETSYTVTDINNEVVVEGSGSAFETFTVMINCTPVTCARPTDLTVNYTGGTTAEVTWEGEAAQYNLSVNGTEISNVTSPYTLTDLELATTYSVMVQGDCGDNGLSNWTSPVSFKTDLCLPEDMCALTFSVTDSYGDGWTGAAINISEYDGETVGDLLVSISNTNAAEAGEAQTYTANFCDGQLLAIIWSSGSYDSEASYTVTDLNGDVVVEGEGEGFDGFAYQMNCTVTDCRKPSDFMASEIGPRSVKLSWTENGIATEWQIEYLSENDEETTIITVTENPYVLEGLEPETMYAAQVTPICDVVKPSEIVYWTTDVACPKPTDLTVTPYPFSADLDWNGFGASYDLDWAEAPASKDGELLLQYDNGTYYTNIGNTTSGVRYWGVMYPKDMLEGNTTLTKVAVQESADYYTCASYLIHVYQGEEQPTTLLGSETVEPMGTTGMHEITLSTPISFNPAQNLWITLEVEGTYVMAACQSTERNNQWWDNNGDGVWTNMADDNSNLAAYGWMIRGYVEGYNDMLFGWESETGVTPPYVLEDLEPSTDYVVRVRANCGEDGVSGWVWIYFTTPSACDAPIELQAEATSNGANLSWIGYQDDYELRYREATKYIPVWEDDFEDGLGNWTIVAGDEATHPSSGIWYTINPVSGLEYESYSGTYCASSWSWNSSAYNADNWLITPQLDLQGALKFYVRTNASYPDSYEVLLSTTTNDVADFTIELQAYAQAPDVAKWNEVIIDLSAYEGQQGYIAIHHEDYDMNYLLIDKFGIYNVIEASDWQVESLSETNFQLTGLTASTDYEWQVRGENRDCDEGEEDGFTDWSELATFTTLEAQGQTIALAAGANWVSFNVETTLTELQTALTDALGTNVSMSIKSQTEFTQLKRGQWTTGFNNFNVAELFIISVPAACEIVLTGAPINPADHEINIVNGANWIAYPNAEPMLITPAFTGFVMANDYLKSQTDYSKFTRGKWTNEALELEPGQGYIYGSAQTDPRPFTFPTPAKAAPKSVSNGPAVQRMPRTTEMY